MDWISFGKRLVITMVICLVLAGLVSFLIFQVLSLYGFSIIVLYFGVFVLIFGACLQTAFVEGLATARYAVNPQVTRDTARHFSERRADQARSGVVILVAGALLLLIGFIGLALVTFFPG
jgi:hypothetical protein